MKLNEVPKFYCAKHLEKVLEMRIFSGEKRLLQNTNGSSTNGSSNL